MPERTETVHECGRTFYLNTDGTNAAGYSVNYLTATYNHPPYLGVLEPDEPPTCPGCGRPIVEAELTTQAEHEAAKNPEPELIEKPTPQTTTPHRDPFISYAPDGRPVWDGRRGVFIDPDGAEYVQMHGYQCPKCPDEVAATSEPGRRPACNKCGRDMERTGNVWEQYTTDGQRVHDEAREATAARRRDRGPSQGEAEQLGLGL